MKIILDENNIMQIMKGCGTTETKNTSKKNILKQNNTIRENFQIKNKINTTVHAYVIITSEYRLVN